VISVADKQTQLEEFEGLKSIKDNVDEFGIDIFELGNLWSLINFLVLFTFINCNQRLITLELLKELLNGAVNYRNNIHNFLHDFILNKNVAFCFDDFDIQVVVFFSIIKNRILRVQLMSDFRN
jgi:hypothetical protein